MNHVVIIIYSFTQYVVPHTCSKNIEATNITQNVSHCWSSSPPGVSIARIELYPPYKIENIQPKDSATCPRPLGFAIQYGPASISSHRFWCISPFANAAVCILAVFFICIHRLTPGFRSHVYRKPLRFFRQNFLGSHEYIGPFLQSTSFRKLPLSYPLSSSSSSLQYPAATQGKIPDVSETSCIFLNVVKKGNGLRYMMHCDKMRWDKTRIQLWNRNRMRRNHGVRTCTSECIL